MINANRKLFHKGHYNILAAQIRKQFPIGNDNPDNEVVRSTLTGLAITLAHRLSNDNENFDPLKFLGACSPDNELYPITELWEDSNVS